MLKEIVHSRYAAIMAALEITGQAPSALSLSESARIRGRVAGPPKLPVFRICWENRPDLLQSVVTLLRESIHDGEVYLFCLVGSDTYFAVRAPLRVVLEHVPALLVMDGNELTFAGVSSADCVAIDMYGCGEYPVKTSADMARGEFYLDFYEDAWTAFGRAVRAFAEAQDGVSVIPDHDWGRLQSERIAAIGTVKLFWPPLNADCVREPRTLRSMRAPSIRSNSPR